MNQMEYDDTENDQNIYMKYDDACNNLSLIECGLFFCVCILVRQ